jgi:hypothetical protein
MLYQILVTIPEACRMPKDSKNMNLRQSLEEDLFTVYVARIPVADEILKVTRESCGKSFTYAYKVLDVDITCYLKPEDRDGCTPLDARVTGLLTDSGY